MNYRINPKNGDKLYSPGVWLHGFCQRRTRGGKLVTNLPKEVHQVWDQAEVKRSPAEWAFRWI